MAEARYPHIIIEEPTPPRPFRLVSEIASALRKNGVSMDEQKEFSREAIIGPDYDELREVLKKWVTLT